jgi:hypothetical protein
MHSIFKNKGVKTTYKQVLVEPKVANPLVRIVDVDTAITKSKVTKEQVFKDKEPIKNFFVVDWEEEQKVQQYFIKTIHEMQIEDPLKKKFKRRKHNII